jgi:hypothetical protein
LAGVVDPTRRDATEIIKYLAELARVSMGLVIFPWWR